jgi:hypothetical protein
MGQTRGDLGWHSDSPWSVDVTGVLTDRPLPGTGEGACRDDGRYTVTTFTGFASGAQIAESSVRVDNGHRDVQLRLTGTRSIELVVVRVCRPSWLPGTSVVCGAPQRFPAPIPRGQVSRPQKAGSERPAGERSMPTPAQQVHARRRFVVTPRRIVTPTSATGRSRCSCKPSRSTASTGGTSSRECWICGGASPSISWVTKRIRRTHVVLAVVTGLLALWTQAANAYITLSHCEPLRRRSPVALRDQRRRGPEVGRRLSCHRVQVLYSPT